VFREMRRSEKALTNAEMLEVMSKAEYGVLSTVDQDGFPYGVPVNFLYKDGNIYFHSALSGHKVDNMAYNNKVSFCVVQDVELIPDDFNTKYKSVIAFGTVSEVEEKDKQDVLVLLLQKFSQNYMAAGMDYINKAISKARVYQIKVEHMTVKGKL
jgi:nitroimidazol reductase NimA-like FMN-containing flavoprotein (pyridoxamine 5'-phosphate oxidase superfamily)